MRRRFMNSQSYDFNSYLTIESLEDEFSVSFTYDLKYSINGGIWNRLKGGESTPCVNVGDRISFKGELLSIEGRGVGTFQIDKSCNLLGNCMSILYGEDLMPGVFDSLFNYCTGIKGVSKDFLPATTLAEYCYNGMFYGCTGLITAPELPATTLASDCYYEMFDGCTSLTAAPELPATTLADGCYTRMFSGCTSLTAAPELPATTLADGCYDGMFGNTNVLPDCSNIDFTSELVVSSGGLKGLFNRTDVTNDDLNKILPLNSNGKYYLPVTTLASYCYSNMFSGCTGLTTAPELPATTLASDCYSNMFSGCTSLTAAPELPATTLADGCYKNMFGGCNKLNYIKMLATDISASYCLINWVSNVASSGTFVKHPDMTTLPSGESGIPTGWTVEDNVDYTSSYFIIESLEDGLTASLSTNACEYRIDDGSWNTLSANSNTSSINKGQTLSFRGNLTPTSSDGIGTFTISKKCNVKGNIMSMLYGDDFIDKNDLTGKGYAFYKLFNNCGTILDVSELILPATALSSNCYRSMFQGCISLRTTPKLPATNVNTYCYFRMFSDCTSLTTAPKLPATDAKAYCYYAMFLGCTSLTIAPELPATIGIFDDQCYAHMFNGCTSLTTAPELPSTTITHYCYLSMFLNCTSLTTAPSLLPATSLYSQCYSYMFKGCTSLTTAPELPAKSLVDHCYLEMFLGCSKLNYIKMLATDINTSSSGCLSNWVSGVASTGTFIKHPDMTTLPSGSSGIPIGWTVESYSNLITFYIDNTEYQAEEGMTWEDWCNSEYNTDDYYCDSNYVRRPIGTNPIIFDVNNGDDCIPTDVIIPNRTYGIWAGGGYN